MKEEHIQLKRLPKDPAGEFMPDLLIEELLDDLCEEDAGDWLLSHFDEDRSILSGKHIYSTALFSITVDYQQGTIAIAAELGCHPVDELLDLKEVMNVIAHRLSENLAHDDVHVRKTISKRQFRHDVLPS